MKSLRAILSSMVAQIALIAATGSATAQEPSRAHVEELFWRAVTANPSVRTHQAYLQAFPEGSHAAEARAAVEAIAEDGYWPPVDYDLEQLEEYMTLDEAEGTSLDGVSAAEFGGVLEWDFIVWGSMTVVEDLDIYILHGSDLIRHQNLWWSPATYHGYVHFNTDPMELGNLITCHDQRSVDRQTWLYQISELRNDGVVFYQDLRPSRLERTNRPYPCIYALRLFNNAVQPGLHDLADLNVAIDAGPVVSAHDTFAEGVRSGLTELGYGPSSSSDAADLFIAIQQFQIDAGLPPDGQATEQVMAAIDAFLDGSAAALRDAARQRTFVVQMTLFRAGYLSEQPAGTPGPETRAAIMAFQNAQGLEADGLITAELLSAMGLQ